MEIIYKNHFIICVLIFIFNDLTAQNQPKFELETDYNFILKVEFDSLLQTGFYYYEFMPKHWVNRRKQKGYLWKVSVKKVLYDYFKDTTLNMKDNPYHEISNIKYILVNYKLHKIIQKEKEYIIACSPSSSENYLRGVNLIPIEFENDRFVHNYNKMIPGIGLPSNYYRLSPEEQKHYPTLTGNILGTIMILRLFYKLKIKINDKILYRQNPYMIDIFEESIKQN